MSQLDPRTSPAPSQPLFAQTGAYSGEVLAWLGMGLFALFVLGFVLIRIPGAEEGSPLNIDRAIFSAVSAVTLTGLQQDVRVGAFDANSAIVPAALLVMTVGSAFLTLVAVGLPACQLLGIRRRARPIIVASAAVVVGGTLLGAVPLLLNDARGLSHGRAWLESFLTAASAVGNSGVAWGSVPRGDAWPAHFVVLPLSVVGGLGVPVIIDLFDRATGRTAALLFHTRLVLVLIAGGYAVGVLLLLAFNERFVSLLWGGITGGGWTQTEFRAMSSMAVSASVLSLNSRSLGLPLEPANVAALPRSAAWVLTLLMAAGAGPASTAGGLRLTTLFLLGRGARRGMEGQRLAPEVGFALGWALTFLTVVSAGFALLLWSAPQLPAERLLMLAVSATSNSGLAHDNISLVLVPLLTLALLMILGRVLPILLLWRMAARLDYAETVPT